MKRALAVVSLLAAVTPAAASEISGELTAEQLKEAIDFGTNAKEVKLYRLSSRMGRVECGFATPFLRVAIAAREAKKNYKPFAEEDARALVGEPLVDVVCTSTNIGGGGPDKDRVFANVQNVLITGKDGTGEVVRPINLEPIPESYQNAYGMKVEASGMLARFPVEAFARPGSEIHVIYDKRVKAGFGGCDDCAIAVKLDSKVR